MESLVKSMFQFLFLIHTVYSHSWIHCIDYPVDSSLQVIQNELCKHWPRGMKATEFGLDQGMNYQPIDNRACRNPFEKAIVYSSKQKIRLLWPAKNHQADVCTNPYIPKGKLGIYIQPVSSWAQPDLPFSEWYTQQYLHQTMEFQNCPYFCSNMDKAACFGDLTLPEQPGKYKMNWIWMFNPGQFYTHCFDIEIQQQSKSVLPSLPPTSSLLNVSRWNCKFCDCVQIRGQ